MDLLKASTFFDEDPVDDGYTGDYLFHAQTASFDDSNSDGATNRRRVLSTGATTVIPARRVIEMYGDRWIVGIGTPDGFYGEVMRQHYSMKRATDLMTLLTPNQLLTAASGTAAWVHRYYFKDGSDALTSSEIDTFWNIFLSPDEPASKGTFFKDATGRLYRVRNDYLPVEGLRVCQSDSLDAGALVSAVWSTGAYDPITDTVAAGSTTVSAVMLETPKFYRFRALSDPLTERGDTAVFVPATITPKIGDTFTIAGKVWRAVIVQPEMDAWAVQARLA